MINTQPVLRPSPEDDGRQEVIWTQADSTGVMSLLGHFHLQGHEGRTHCEEDARSQQDVLCLTSGLPVAVCLRGVNDGTCSV